MDVKSKKSTIKILWLSPTFNHYKASFLNLLNDYPEIELSVLYGTGRKNMGDKESSIHVSYIKYFVGVSKSKFGFSSKARRKLKELFSKYDLILIPREKKNFVLILYASFLREKIKNNKGKKVKLISYNHPYLKTNGKITFLDRLFMYIFYKIYDKIIFYTQKGYDDVVLKGLINKDKAYWANNTINTKEVVRYYKFCYPDTSVYTILFIGRLIPMKKVEVFLEYYFEIKKILEKNDKKLKAIIIGDGPQRVLVEDAIKKDPTIEWTGALVDEKNISVHMKKANLVYVPGHSGLSINHAFAYGRPYFTIESATHPPEIAYIKHGENGYIMGKDKDNNISLMVSFLENYDKSFYDNAKYWGEKLSIDNWCKKMIQNFIE